MSDLLATAGSRLDLVAAEHSVDALAGQLGMTRWSRWLGDLELGVERETEPSGEVLQGPTLEFEVPLFNQHRDDLLVAQAGWQAATAELRALKLDIDNAVRLAHAGVDNARAKVSVHRERLIPARQAGVARAQEEVNFMLTGVFDLLEVKQEELAAYEEYLHSLGDYWAAHTELAKAVGSRLAVTPGEAVVIDAPLDADAHRHHHGSHHEHHGGSQ